MKIDQIVREAGYYTLADAAKLVGRSPDTLRRWRALGIFESSHVAMFGELEVSCYTKGDIRKMRRLTRTIKTGRPPLNRPPLALVT